MDSVMRLVLTHRRVIAALLAGLAAWSAISAIRHSPDSRSVVVAAHDLASGSTVASGDLEVRQVPSTTLPDGVIDAEAARGRVLSGAMRSGEIFTDRRVVDSRDLGDGRVLAMAEVPMVTGEVLRTGDVVDLLVVDEDRRADRVARRVEVVTVHADADRGTTSIGVAATSAVASTLARAAVTSRLTAVIVARQ